MPIARERVLYEDQWLLAVTKLGGELVVRGKGKLQRLPLLDFLRKEYPTVVAVHRLDFETSGVVVFAKSGSVLSSIIDSSFAGWKKTYRAILLGCPAKKEGVVDIRLPARSGEGKVEASTAYKVLENLDGSSLVELTIERGQRHQIRRHMAMIGHPLVLDDEYGEKKANKIFGKFLRMSHFLLHALSVSFPHPITREETVILSPEPPSFLAAVKKIRAAARR